VGTGPYLFKEWKAGEKVVLAANADYFGGRPYISRVVYRIIPSSATTFLELKAKGVDGAKLTALQFKRQTEYPAFRKAYNKYQYAANVYVYFGMNLRDARFADRRVRQAFAHAINKRELIEGVPARGDRAVQARYLAVQARAPVPVRPEEARAWPKPVKPTRTPTASW
jgi:peptide/nickel transport system substrate-binding protein